MNLMRQIREWMDILSYILIPVLIAYVIWRRSHLRSLDGDESLIAAGIGSAIALEILTILLAMVSAARHLSFLKRTAWGWGLRGGEVLLIVAIVLQVRRVKKLTAEISEERERTRVRARSRPSFGVRSGLERQHRSDR